jgi:hypothetical protein
VKLILLACAQGSLSSPFAAKVVIVRTGDKFPPHGYDPNAAPGAIVTNTTRRNGQVRITRRAGKPIVVSRRTQGGRLPVGEVEAFEHIEEVSRGLRGGHDAVISSIQVQKGCGGV